MTWHENEKVNGPTQTHLTLLSAVTSVLAIGGIGGLAIGLAGREICENILNGFLIMSTVRQTSNRCSRGMKYPTDRSTDGYAPNYLMG